MALFPTKKRLIQQGADESPVKALEGGERIFSREDTEILMKMAKTAKTDNQLQELGRFLYEAIAEQDMRQPEYTSEYADGGKMKDPPVQKQPVQAPRLSQSAPLLGGPLRNLNREVSTYKSFLNDDQIKHLAQAITKAEMARDGDTPWRKTFGGAAVDLTGSVFKAALGLGERSFGDINMKPSARPEGMKGDNPFMLNNPAYAQRALDLKIQEMEQYAIINGVSKDKLMDTILTMYNQGNKYADKVVAREKEPEFSIKNQLMPYKTDSYAEEVYSQLPSPMQVRPVNQPLKPKLKK